MDHKFICLSYDCSVYVFGSSSEGKCPECKQQGLEVVDESLLESFLEWIKSAQNRSFYPITTVGG